jgi:hypothetical protein
MIRAKMQCSSVTDQTYGPDGAKDGESVRLDAVYGADGSSNAQWSKYTPSGTVTMLISNPDAWGKVKAGRFYFVDFAETTGEG